jgi:hypothetical protein
VEANVTVRVTGITIAVLPTKSDGGGAFTLATTSASNEVLIGADGDNGAGWSRRLDKPVKLPGGTTLRTLAEAGAYILGLPEEIKQRNSWQRATDLLLRAASGAASVEDATAQIEYALFRERTPLLSGENARSVWE